MIKAVIFDLDDTLYNEREFVYGGFKEVCSYLAEKHNLNCDELFNETIHILNLEGRGKIFNIICEKYEIYEDIKKLVGIYRGALPQIKLYKDSIYILNRLKENYKIGLITDGMASVQWNKIKCLGIEHSFDKIVVTDDHGREYWKPHEFSYREMLNNFNCKSCEVVYVGDNPHKDFIGARKVGLCTVRIIREFGDHMKTKLTEEYEADYEIKDLRELEELLSDLI